MTEPASTARQARISHLRLAIEIISDKWRISVLHQLMYGPLRTGQLQKALDEVAPKVLTQTLRGLERDGLIQRKTYAVAPPRVDYRLTEAAVSLLPSLDALCCWSETYGGHTLTARKSYDAVSNPHYGLIQKQPSRNRWQSQSDRTSFDATRTRNQIATISPRPMRPPAKVREPLRSRLQIPRVESMTR